MTGHRETVTWFRAHRARLIAGAAILTVAVVTGRVSYLHIYELSVALHQPPGVARLMPFGVDGLIVVGSVVLLQSANKLGWVGIATGTAISLYANVESAIGYGWRAASWAGVPAVTFALSTLIFERWLSKTPAPGDDSKPRALRAVTPGLGQTPVPPPSPAAEPGPLPVPLAPRAASQTGQGNRAAVLTLKSLNPEWTHKEIAAELGIVPRTVSRHLAAVNGSQS